MQKLQHLSLQGLANEINLVLEDLKTKENYIQILKVIIRQYEIERNLYKYKTVERRVIKSGLEGEPIKATIAPPSNARNTLDYQLNNIYIPVKIHRDGVFVVANHYNDYGYKSFFVPHESYVVLEEINL